MSVCSSIEALIKYLKNGEPFELTDSFIALREKNSNIYKDKETSFKYLETLKGKLQDLEVVKEDSHYLFYYSLNSKNMIAKVKEVDSKIISIYEDYKAEYGSIQLYLEYDGSGFNGMQKLPDGFRTIQGEVEHALEKMLKKHVDVRIASRTDKGVHAKRQVVSFPSFGINASKYMYSLNLILPEDIRIVEANEKSELFDARFDVVSKTYEYLIDRGEPSVYKNKYVLYHKINNLERMKNELRSIEGTHDFQSFEKGSKEDSTRTIFKTEIKEEGELVRIIFTGNGFLHNMIRFIVGSLINIDETNEGSLQEILESKSKNMTPYLASPSGLYLTDIKY